MEINVEAFTGTYREALRGAVDKEQAVLKTVEETIRLYQYLAEQSMIGDHSGLQYLDALDRAIERARLSEIQERILECMFNDMSTAKIAEYVPMFKNNVSRDKEFIVRKIASEYAKGDK